MKNYFLCKGTFNDNMLEDFMEFYTDSINHEDAYIFINSWGGNVCALNSMLSLMENSPTRFHTVAVGDAFSCGCLLLAGGDVRYATDRATVMLHDISCMLRGQPDQIKEDLEHAAYVVVEEGAEEERDQGPVPGREGVPEVWYHRPYRCSQKEEQEQGGRVQGKKRYV